MSKNVLSKKAQELYLDLLEAEKKSTELWKQWKASAGNPDTRLGRRRDRADLKAANHFRKWREVACRDLVRAGWDIAAVHFAREDKITGLRRPDGTDDLFTVFQIGHQVWLRDATGSMAVRAA